MRDDRLRAQRLGLLDHAVRQVKRCQHARDGFIRTAHKQADVVPILRQLVGRDFADDPLQFLHRACVHIHRLRHPFKLPAADCPAGARLVRTKRRRLLHLAHAYAALPGKVCPLLLVLHAAYRRAQQRFTLRKSPSPASLGKHRHIAPSCRMGEDLPLHGKAHLGQPAAQQRQVDVRLQDQRGAAGLLSALAENPQDRLRAHARDHDGLYRPVDARQPVRTDNLRTARQSPVRQQPPRLVKRRCAYVAGNHEKPAAALKQMRRQLPVIAADVRRAGAFAARHGLQHQLRHRAEPFVQLNHVPPPIRLFSKKSGNDGLPPKPAWGFHPQTPSSLRAHIQAFRSKTE